MKKVRFLIAILGGAIAGLIAGLLLSTEQRERLSRQLAGFIKGMVGHMPDG